MLPRPDGHWLAVYGSIVTGVFVAVGVGHKGNLDVVAGFEGQRSSEKGLGRVHVLKDGPWRLGGYGGNRREMCSSSLLWRCGANFESRGRQTTVVGCQFQFI